MKITIIIDDNRPPCEITRWDAEQWKREREKLDRDKNRQWDEMIRRAARNQKPFPPMDWTANIGKRFRQ